MSSPATVIQVNIEELNLACTRGNRLIIKEGKTVSKPICGKPPPVLTSMDNSLEFNLHLANPGKHVSYHFLKYMSWKLYYKQSILTWLI